MGLFDKIKALWSLNSFYKKIKEEYKMDSTVKPGWKTSEFWLSLLALGVTLVGALNSLIPADKASMIIAVISGVYGIIRAVTKSNAPVLVVPEQK